MTPGLLIPLSFANGHDKTEPIVSAIISQNGTAVLGCQDGTSFLLHESRPSLHAAAPQDEPKFTRSSRPASPADSRTTSRSISPASTSSGLAPFVVASRARISSGITKEQVEAPKNFVDYDEEPDKLKDLLKGRRPTNKRGSLDASVATLSAEVTSKRKDGAYGSLLSANNSPAFTPVSTPSSPIANHQALEFQCHVFPPPRFGQPQVVADLMSTNDDCYLTLYVSGDLSVTSSLDGQCLTMVHMDDGHSSHSHHDVSVNGRSHRHGWLWRCLHRIQIAQSTFIVASGSINSDMVPPDIENDDNQQQSRLIVFEYTRGDQIGAASVALTQVAEWFVTGTSVGTSLDDGPAILHYVSWEKHLFLSSIQLTAAPLVQPFEIHSSHDQSGLAALPNPFKSNKVASIETVPVQEKEPVVERIVLKDCHDAGILDIPGVILGVRIRTMATQRILCWSESHLVGFQYIDTSLRPVFTNKMENIERVEWFTNAVYAIAFPDRIEVYSLVPWTPGSFPVLVHTLQTGLHDLVQMVSPLEALIVDRGNDNGELQVTRITYDQLSSNKTQRRSRRLLQTTSSESTSGQRGTLVTSVLPLDLDLIITGHDDGLLRTTSFSQLCQESLHISQKISDVALDGCIVSLHVVRNGRTKERYIVGGADDGSIAFWNADTFKLNARWIVFVTPLTHVFHLKSVSTGPLRGCVLCVSQDGTIAVFVIDGFQFLYIIPGSAFPLVRVCLGEDNLLLMYADRRARAWDIKTKEFWRSMNADKAEEMLAQGGWTDLYVRRFITEAIYVMKTISTSRNQTRIILSRRDRLRTLLSALLTHGLNKGIDEICQEDLDIPLSSVAVGITSHGSVATFTTKCASDRWCISGDVTASLALAITTALRALGLFEELTDATNTVASFYATSLASAAGEKYQHPSLAFLARHWLNGSQETRQSARFLFDAAVVRLTEESALSIAEQWQHHLPCLQPTADRETLRAALSLFICGYLAAEKYSLFPTSTLTDISKSIQLYLHDEQSLFRVLAVDLCSRGFHIWQHYIDAMEILRSLRHIRSNIGAQARSAVLQIAGSNTPLFMTTLGLDILSPVSVEYRKSVLQIVAFLIRKRPMVLYPNLPKLMESVVKSLDPNSTAHRDAVLDTATEILGHVVKTFPSIDFHTDTQRLAVGTSEGALVMYDLKTATRLYVLENHKKRIAACSFSPDGRRLVTLSLEESVVLVWKVGSSFSSFFNPGAPPRQGHAGSEPSRPYLLMWVMKMTIADSLRLVQFEWPAERSVRLKIRESVLTFST
ncbi:WD40 repeat-like protein [Hymenopellis radicata]|nr:WD40 repeat-like protein [Hymenopellis radicata]